MDGYALAALSDIDERSDGRCAWRAIRHHFGITSFGVNAWTGHAAGDRIINEHTEDESDSHEELYVVLSGSATFELDGERRQAPAGTFVAAAPGVRRTAFADEPNTTILALGGQPGHPYQPTGWDLWAPLAPLYTAGEYAEVADRGAALLADEPPYATLYFNIACCESRVGRIEDALVHLRRAIELHEPMRELARTDSDLDPLRLEPAFRALTAADGG